MKEFVEELAMLVRGANSGEDVKSDSPVGGAGTLRKILNKTSMKLTPRDADRVKPGQNRLIPFDDKDTIPDRFN